MSYCPKCGRGAPYSANGSEMIINCRGCGEMTVRFRGTPYPYSDNCISCPFCGGLVYRHKIGDCNEIIWFCENCLLEFVLPAEEKLSTLERVYPIDCIYVKRHHVELPSGLRVALHCTNKQVIADRSGETRCRGRPCRYFTTSDDETPGGEVDVTRKNELLSGVRFRRC